MTLVNKKLHKELLEAARSAERRGLGPDQWREVFHLMPPVGWLNDPNGLIQKDGVTHIFFQYNPLDTKPGPQNYWGHYTTKDFVHYDLLPPALTSDTPRDASGVYSGSAAVRDGKLQLYYTGNVKHPGNHDYTHTGREHNTMTAVSNDGVHFEDKQVLLTNDNYPANCTLHVRDPKFIRYNNANYLVLGARRDDDTGEVLVYKEGKRDEWHYEGILKSDAPFGYMWECPDLFTIGDTTFLSVSPQGVEAEGDKYNNIYQSGTYKVRGHFPDNTTLSDFEELDHGFDFYAPQTYEDEQGRRILIGWMGLPDIPYENPTQGWMHTLTMPRELTEKHGKLYQTPLPEYQALRESETTAQSSGETLSFNEPGAFEAIITPSVQTAFKINIRGGCTVEWDGQKLSLSFDEQSGQGRTIRRTALSALTELNLFVDTSSIEIFANNGEAVFTSRFYPTGHAPAMTVTGLTGTAAVYTLSPFIITDKQF